MDMDVLYPHEDNQLKAAHARSEWAVELSLQEAAAWQWQGKRVKEDPNVAVSKEQRLEMRLVVEVSFQHGSQEEKKKTDKHQGSNSQTALLWREKSEKTEPCGLSAVS